MYTIKTGTGSVNADHPQAWIAIQKNRQKVYTAKSNDSQVFLKDGQEFQIELYNPTQTPHLAKIKLNGKYTSERGLILKPGQRYFLDRFVDEDKKLVFSTYDVEPTEEAKKAIEKNGLLEVEFYMETAVNYWGGLSGNSTITITNPYYSTGTNFMGTTSTYLSGNAAFTNTTSINTSYAINGVLNEASIETGRIEKGEQSGQSFIEGSGNFNSWTSSISRFHIIPVSQKPVETQEIRSYCTDCGTRIKKQNWKFCPNCGTAVE